MFIVIGVVGALILLSTIVFDDWLDELIPGFDVVSGPVVGAFMMTFGLFGWYAGAGPALSPLATAALAIGAGGVAAYVAYRVFRALDRMATDSTPTSSSLVGKTGKIVTPVRAGGIGEALVTLGGASTKYTVTADEDLPNGAEVVVVSLESPTKLRVQAETTFWA